MAATRGRPRRTTIESTYVCACCSQEQKEKEFYTSHGLVFRDKKVPICKKCVEEIYNKFLEKYVKEQHENPERDALRRICMCLDFYFSNKLYKIAMKNLESKPNSNLISAYFKIIQLSQYSRKSYDDTLFEEDVENNDSLGKVLNSDDIDESTIKFFGSGFIDEDYRFLKEQYDDWTARHECKTKAQEEVFKRLCFKQLEILKATRQGDDTKELDATFQKLLETAKLQPKQNSSETLSDAQSFGTLIDKWENTKPIPEVDDDLKDVDNMILYTDVFFRGHLAKFMGLKNGVSNTYTEYMKKYTVERPEYSDEEDSEALFDAIFGNGNIDV